mgnify:CR=1 FL=1
MSGTKNFQAKEFFSKEKKKSEKKITQPAKYDGKLQAQETNLQKIRDRVGPLNINSGYRTTKYNATVGGASNSQHLYAKAADISSPTMTGPELHAVVMDLINQGAIHNGGVGKYDTFVHYDIRDQPARWDESTPGEKKKAARGAGLLALLSGLVALVLVKKR